jgi:hypothetical protein
MTLSDFLEKFCLERKGRKGRKGKGGKGGRRRSDKKERDKRTWYINMSSVVSRNQFSVTSANECLCTCFWGETHLLREQRKRREGGKRKGREKEHILVYQVFSLLYNLHFSSHFISSLLFRETNSRDECIE